nr:putative ribonuclease H-like domain-containing protein [Tanacetum cinerariifolium]
MRPFGYPVTILNTIDPLGKFDGKADEGFLVGYYVSNPQNTDSDATFEVKEPEFKVEKPESEVHVSPSSSTKTQKHDDKTKREAKGKSPVKLATRFRNLCEEFEDFFDDSTNKVNAASTLVPAVGQISTNNPHTFSVDGLEDITYSDDEEDVGVEADFTNLETTITVSPIPTTRVHKDHHVTQIIGDLSSATQTIRGATSIQDAKVAYSDSDYAGASLDRKSTIGGFQFLGWRLISWQCKKQTVVATSSIKAEYVAAASCCAQVLWIQNQLLDYG